MSDEGWTIDELAERAADALASEGVRAPSGRVRLEPDRRVIRWYATIGLLDPPLATRGRIARYGERHLLQLVAVKRRQAEGHSLATIQAELAGATDTTLRQVASLPGRPIPGPPTGQPGTAALRSTAVPTGVAASANATVLPNAAKTAPERQQFWRTPVTTAAGHSTAIPPAASPAPADPGPGQPFHVPVRIVEQHLAVEPAAGHPVTPVYPVPLHPAATLTLPAQPTADDLAAIHAAAKPLLDLLADRGLLPDRRTT